MNIKKTDQEKLDYMNNLRSHGGLGPENKHRLNSFTDVQCTDAVWQHAEVAEAFWFLDIVASYQSVFTKEEKQFLIWELEVREEPYSESQGAITPDVENAHTIEETKDCDWVARVTAKIDSDRPPCVDQRIGSTDHPAGTFKFYQEWGCVLLPEER